MEKYSVKVDHFKPGFHNFPIVHCSHSEFFEVLPLREQVVIYADTIRATPLYVVVVVVVVVMVGGWGGRCCSFEVLPIEGEGWDLCGYHQGVCCCCCCVGGSGGGGGRGEFFLDFAIALREKVGIYAATIRATPLSCWYPE